MEITVQVIIFLAGLVVALLASTVAVKYARALAAALRLPGFIVGVGLVAIGTDLPEIANSIASHLQDEGDVNVGDSVGSALTQYTLVLGVVPLVVATIVVRRREVTTISLLTIFGLALTAGFVSDGWLARWEGAVLCSCWVIAMWIVLRVLPEHVVEPVPEVRYGSRLAQAGTLLVSLGAVAAGATFAVRALVRLAEDAGVPEFVLAFFGASFGTSAPELVVVITAVMRGAPGIALGDALGSSMADATLSIGAGPFVAPAEVTARLGVVGASYAIAAVAIVGIVLGARERLDRRAGAVLLGLYALAYVVVLGTERT